MIVGTGMIANALKKYDRKDVLFFCSGVSNSLETNPAEFSREIELIKTIDATDKKVIYFSSYFVSFPQFLLKKYYEHKYRMEILVASNFPKFIIYRLPQVVGKSTNPQTLTNFINGKILSQEVLSVYKGVKRNLVDVDDVASVIDYINRNNLFLNQTVNLISPKSYEVSNIVNVFERVVKRSANVEFLSSVEENFDVLLSGKMLRIYEELQIHFDELYLENIISKYYGSIK